MNKRILVSLAALFLFAANGRAENVDQTLGALDQNIRSLENQLYTIPAYKRPQVVRRLDYAVRDIQRIQQELQGPGQMEGWYAAAAQSCANYCQSIGMYTAVSPEGAQCVSGENHAASAVGVVPFVYGCTSDCAPQAYNNAVSVGQYCYKPGQKQDNDRTDITVGCYCR